jgi:hypothetical protein
MQAPRANLIGFETLKVVKRYAHRVTLTGITFTGDRRLAPLHGDKIAFFPTPID